MQPKVLKIKKTRHQKMAEFYQAADFDGSVKFSDEVVLFRAVHIIFKMINMIKGQYFSDLCAVNAIHYK